MDVIKFLDTDQSSNTVYIYYPACDSEFIWTNEFDTFINKISASSQKAIVSIATKAKLKPSILRRVKEINQDLISRQTGFIKISTSFSTKRRIDELEKGTLNYIQRVEQLTELNELGIPSSLILKPILPFVDLEEYKEIIDDTHNIIEYYSLGGLYFSLKSDFFKSYIENKYAYIFKKAEWLSYKPEWGFIESKEKADSIRKYIASFHKQAFLSDQEMLEKMWRSIISSKNETQPK